MFRQPSTQRQSVAHIPFQTVERETAGVFNCVVVAPAINAFWIGVAPSPGQVQASACEERCPAVQSAVFSVEIGPEDASPPTARAGCPACA